MIRKLHQIWVGPPMPNKCLKWTRRLREASEKAGWDYRLWGIKELEEVFSSYSSLAFLISTLKGKESNIVLATLLSDFARYVLLAHFGGLYLDTDWKLTTPTFPEFPTDPGIWGQNEYYAPDPAENSPCTGIFWVPTEKDRKDMKEIFICAEARVLSASRNSEHFFNWLLPHPHRLPYFIGPRWLKKLDIRILPLSPFIATHCQWGNDAPLIHMGMSSWAKKTRDLPPA